MAPRATKPPDSARNAPKSPRSGGKSAATAAKPAASRRKAASAAPASGDAARPSAAPSPAVPPEALGPAGLKVWRSVVADYDLRPDELRILEDACREATLIDRLHHELQGAPLVVKGSMGQPTASPLVQEIRQHRQTFAALMARLKLEDIDGAAAGDRSARARAAAQARWRRGS